MNDHTQQSFHRLEKLISQRKASQLISTKKISNEIKFLQSLIAAEYGKEREARYIWQDESIAVPAALKPYVIKNGKPFSTYTLAKGTRGNYCRESRSLNINTAYFDHAYYYKDAEGYPLMIVAHLYNMPNDLQLFARQNNLKSVIRRDWKSWWNPGGCDVVEYTRLKKI